jgi:hypothetical protein
MRTLEQRNSAVHSEAGSASGAFEAFESFLNLNPAVVIGMLWLFGCSVLLAGAQLAFIAVYTLFAILAVM